MLRWGKVVELHPEDNSVDLTMTDDGARLAGVQVLSMSASSRSGIVDLPSPGEAKSGDEKWRITESTDDDVLAAVAYFGHLPVVIGFRFPQVNQMLFKELGRRIHRHESDVYTSLDKDGNFELSHPSGTFFRVGVTPEHENLSGKDADGKWGVSRNTDKAVYAHLVVGNGGAVKADILISPNGDLKIVNEGKIEIETTGTAEWTAQKITLNGPVEVSGNIEVSGEATIAGGLDVTGGSFKHEGKNVGSGHRHGGVQSGGSMTSAPT